MIREFDNRTLLGEIGGCTAVLDDWGGELLFVVFSNRNWARRKEDDFWSAGFFRKYKVSTLGFTDPDADWFPQASIVPLIEQIRATGLLDRFSRIVTYGFSMGGYAALKYASRLGADLAVAMSPQVSVNPDVVGSFDRRYRDHYNPDLHAGMEIEASDLPPESWVVFDPHYRDDLGHVEMLEKLAPVNRVHSYGGKHFSVMLMTESGNGMAFLELVMDNLPDKAKRARRMVREARHKSYSHLAQIGEHLLTRGAREQAIAAFLKSKALREAINYPVLPHVQKRLEELGAGQATG